MAKKSPAVAPKKIIAPAKVAAAPVVSAVRNSPIPKPQTIAAAAAALTPARSAVTHDMIARRAYEIACSGQGGDETANWLRAESELRGV